MRGNHPGNSPVEPYLYTVTTRHAEYHILVEFSCPCDNTSEVRLLTNHFHTIFGPFNVEADAENELEKLRMKENHKIAKYIVSFSQLAPKVQ
jgi:hypothetical protein